MDQANQAQQPYQKNSVGPTIGIIIVVILLIAAAFYYWNTAIKDLNKTPAPEEQPMMSSSDEINVISNDLEATIINGVEGDLDAIEQEINL